METGEEEVRKAVADAFLAILKELKKIYGKTKYQIDANLILSVGKAHRLINDYSFEQLKKVLVAIHDRFGFHGRFIDHAVVEQVNDALGRIGAYEVFEASQKGEPEG